MGKETDRELLELAAKAAGVHPNYYESSECNPLKNNGKAFILATKFCMHIVISKTKGQYGECDVFVHGKKEIIHITSSGERQKATRRAIVLAAAEIGKGMK